MNLSLTVKEMFGQNEMNIYQNEEKDIFMTRNQIGQALEYVQPNTAIRKIHKRHQDRLADLSVGCRLVGTDGKSYETIVYNEKGIYEIIRKSNQPKADAFYDWVYELLSKLRKNELIINKPSSTKLLLETALEHEERIAEIRTDVTMLKDTMRIDGRQEHKLQKMGRTKVVRALGGKKSPAYKELSRSVFQVFWNEFKDHFLLPRYNELPKKDFDEAVAFIKAWRPRTSLRLKIDATNGQITMEDDAS